MADGWIKIHRSLCEHNLWLDEPFTRGQAWVDLLMLANHKEGFVIKRGIKVDLKRGEIGWGEDALAERWGWSRGKVRRYFDMLLSLQMIQKIKHGNTSVSGCIRVINYEKYQSNDTEDDTEDNTEDGQKTDRRRYRNKNEKNYIATCKKDFESLWELYRSRRFETPVGEKKKAVEKYIKLREKHDAETLFEHTKSYLDECNKTKTKTKHVITFLNNHDFSEDILMQEEKKEFNEWDCEP